MTVDIKRTAAWRVNYEEEARRKTAGETNCRGRKSARDGRRKRAKILRLCSAEIAKPVPGRKALGEAKLFARAWKDGKLAPDIDDQQRHESRNGGVQQPFCLRKRWRRFRKPSTSTWEWR